MFSQAEELTFKDLLTAETENDTCDPIPWIVVPDWARRANLRAYSTSISGKPNALCRAVFAGFQMVRRQSISQTKLRDLHADPDSDQQTPARHLPVDTHNHSRAK